MSLSHYDLLEITPEASAEDVDLAYQARARVLDPVRYHSRLRASIESQRHALDEAYRILREPRLRKQYDRQLGQVPSSVVASTLLSGKLPPWQVALGIALVVMMLGDWLLFLVSGPYWRWTLPLTPCVIIAGGWLWRHAREGKA